LDYVPVLSARLHPECLEAFQLRFLRNLGNCGGPAENIDDINFIRNISDGCIDPFAQNFPVCVIGIDKAELEALALKNTGYKVAGPEGIRGDSDDANGPAVLQDLP
jgi:hypothetical protein